MFDKIHARVGYKNGLPTPSSYEYQSIILVLHSSFLTHSLVRLGKTPSLRFLNLSIRFITNMVKLERLILGAVSLAGSQALSYEPEQQLHEVQAGNGRAKPECGPGAKLLSGRCVMQVPPGCPPGAAFDGRNCVVDEPPTCPAESTFDGKSCIVRIKPACPAGTYLSNVYCVLDQRPLCPPGTIFDGSFCASSQRPICPPGLDFDGNICVAQKPASLEQQSLSDGIASEPDLPVGSNSEWENPWMPVKIQTPEANTAGKQHSGWIPLNNPVRIPDNSRPSASPPPNKWIPFQPLAAVPRPSDDRATPECPPGFQWNGRQCASGSAFFSNH